MTTLEQPSEEVRTSTRFEDIVFWISATVVVAFLSFTVIDLGNITLSLRSTKAELVTDQKNLVAINQQIAEAQKDLGDTPANIALARQTLAGLEDDVAQKRDELKLAEGDLTEKSAAVTAAEQQLASLNEQITNAKGNADKILAELNSEIEKRKDEQRKSEEVLAAQRREFCTVVRTLLHSEAPIAARFRPAAEYCGFPLPTPPHPG